MKKRGFTLAEVMVALTLVGVIASLTIPTFVASSRNKANAAKLATTISAVENAFTTMIASEAVRDFSETKFVNDPTALNLGDYFKTTTSGATLVPRYGSANPYIDLDGNALADFPVTRFFESKNGAIITYNTNSVSKNPETVVAEGGSITNSVGRLYIDVNGPAKPNTWGRDVFYFRIGNDGLLYPAGGVNFAILEGQSGKTWRSANSDFSCGTSKRTIGCTARLIENNYDIDY